MLFFMISYVCQWFCKVFLGFCHRLQLFLDGFQWATGATCSDWNCFIVPHVSFFSLFHCRLLFRQSPRQIRVSTPSGLFHTAADERVWLSRRNPLFERSARPRLSRSRATPVSLSAVDMNVDDWLLSAPILCTRSCSHRCSNLRLTSTAAAYFNLSR